MPIIEAKKDCFAYDAKRRECGVCTSMICKERCACPFYKTKEALELARRKSAQRILDVSGVDPQVRSVWLTSLERHRRTKEEELRDAKADKPCRA